MNRAKIVLGVATLISAILTVPVLWWFLFGEMTGSPRVHEAYAAFCILHGALFLVYYRDVFRNDRVPDERKHAWTIILFLGVAFAQLAYFWRFMRPGSALAARGA